MNYALLLILLLVGCTQVTEQDIDAAANVVEQIDTADTINTTEITAVVEELLPPQPQTIVALGDSLTAGPGVAENETYPAQLQALLRERTGINHTVMNAGVGGELSAGTRARINNVLAQNPDIVIVETGVNDILQGVPTNTTIENLDAIISELQTNNVTVILAGMEAYGSYGGYTIQITTMYPSIAERHHVKLIPFFLAGVAGVPELNLPDHVHPNAAGYRIIAEQNVLPVVEEQLDI
jgi:acyl-CoA thioesterase I